MNLFRSKIKILRRKLTTFTNNTGATNFPTHKKEEGNRQFIEIYGLQDELTPNVPLEDITILKKKPASKTETIWFPCQTEGILPQFMILCSPGCMFGRYSLDKEGLILAQGETLQDYLKYNIEKMRYQLTFLAR